MLPLMSRQIARSIGFARAVRGACAGSRHAPASARGRKVVFIVVSRVWSLGLEWRLRSAAVRRDEHVLAVDAQQRLAAERQHAAGAAALEAAHDLEPARAADLDA